MGAGLVWTPPTRPLPGNAGGGGGSGRQDRIRAARITILCVPCLIQSQSSFCWWRDTTACSRYVAPSSATIWATRPATGLVAVLPCRFLGFDTTVAGSRHDLTTILHSETSYFTNWLLFTHFHGCSIPAASHTHH